MQSNIKILIVGKTGHGKSTLANAFLGKSGVFTESSNLTSQTKKCQKDSGRLFGNTNINVDVVDTPGFLDTSGTDEVILQEIFNTFSQSKDGFNICIIPLSILDQRLEGGTINMLNMVQILLGSNVLKHIFIVITQLNKMNSTELSRQMATIDKSLANNLSSQGFSQIANISQLVYYHHGKNPNGLEPLSRIFPGYTNSFKPQTDQNSIEKYLLALVREFQQEKKKMQEDFLKQVQVFEGSKIQVEQWRIFIRLLMLKDKTNSPDMPCLNEHKHMAAVSKTAGRNTKYQIVRSGSQAEVVPSIYDFTNVGNCSICNDWNLSSYQCHYYCMECPQKFCNNCVQKFAQIDLHPNIQISQGNLAPISSRLHHHPLKRSFRQIQWICDGQCGFTCQEFNSMLRYSCPNCDFDLCENCIKR